MVVDLVNTQTLIKYSIKCVAYMEKVSLDGDSMLGYVRGYTNKIKEAKGISLLTHILMEKGTLCVSLCL